MNHQQLDEQFIRSGKFTRAEINDMNSEFEDTLSDLLNTERESAIFLKRRMGLIGYLLWKISPGYWCITLGTNNTIEKAKQYGFRSRRW